MANPVHSGFRTISNADIDTIEEVAEQEIHGAHTMLITFLVGVANLSNFEVQVKAHPLGNYVALTTADADYTTPVYPVLKASGNLNAAAFGATVHYLKLDVTGVFSIKLLAAGTSSTLTGHMSWS